MFSIQQTAADMSRIDAGLRRWPVVSPLLAGAAVGCYFIPGLAAWLQHDREALLGGQLWRLVTCHWMHWTPAHLWWEAIAFVILGVWCEHLSRRRWMVLLIAASLLVPLIMWLVLRGVETYRGLSGLNAALFGLLTVMLIRRNMRLQQRHVASVIGVALLVLTIKTLWDLITQIGDPIASMAPVPLAHLVGGVIGIGIACIGEPPIPEDMRTPW
jgi:rhomboid family GlyGly-CTERM serine protease